MLNNPPLKTASEKSNSKSAGATNDLISNKVVDKIMKASCNLPKIVQRQLQKIRRKRYKFLKKETELLMI